MLSKAISQHTSFLGSKTNGGADYSSQQSRPQSSSIIKRKILEKLNQMDDRELLRVGNDLNINAGDIKSLADDRASVLTLDRLKKFNEIGSLDGATQ